MGADLERIREILESEDRLGQLKAEAQRGIPDERRREILSEAMAINARMREQVRAKRAVLDGFLAELEAKAEYYVTVAVDLGLDSTGAHAGREGDRRGQADQGGLREQPGVPGMPGVPGVPGVSGK